MMADNQAQQIMQADAYRPQHGCGGEWLGTQLEHPAESAGLNQYTVGADPDGDAARLTRGGMVAIVILLAAATLTAGTVGFALVWMVRP